MHHKLIVLGIVLVVAVAFGFLFWGDFLLNQQEIANTPMSTGEDTMVKMPSSSDSLSSSDSYDSLEKELNSTNLEIDSDNASLESEASGL
jgi:hypothetical protein